MNAAATIPATSTTAIRVHPRRMLLPLIFFEIVGGLDAEAARGACEDGSLWPSFNLAAATGSGHRLELHVWRGALENCQPGRDVKPRGDLNRIIAAVLPWPGTPSANPATVGATELAFRFCCSISLIGELIRAGEIAVLGKPPGPKITPRVSCSSAVEFLKRRVFL